MTQPRLPSGYLPYGELNFCSNVLVNVPVPLSVGDQPVLLVGRGLSLLSPVPRVWLAAPAAPPEPDSKEWVKEWAFVLEGNRPSRALITVEADREKGTVVVRVGGLLAPIAVQVKQTGPDAAVIEALDLRPLGLVAYGNERELHIGGTKLEGNHFHNLMIAFAIGPQPAGA